MGLFWFCEEVVGGFVLFPVFEVADNRVSDPGFVELVESKANVLIGKYSLVEHNFIARKISHKGRLNRVFILYKVEYWQRCAPQALLKRQTSHSARETPSKRRSLPSFFEIPLKKHASDAAPQGVKKLKRGADLKHDASGSKKLKADSSSMASATESGGNRRTFGTRMASIFDDEDVSDAVTILSPIATVFPSSVEGTGESSKDSLGKDTCADRSQALVARPDGLSPVLERG